MTQVPASSHGGGTFNGGTITSALDVQAGASSPYIDAKTAGLTYGSVLIVTEDSGGAQHVGLSSAGGGTLIFAGGSAQASDIAAFFSANAGQTADIVSITNSGGVEQCGYNKNGYWYTKRIAAPDDAELAASQVMLWLDDTPGAASTKLMVKAKDSGGTVRTASIVLT